MMSSGPHGFVYIATPIDLALGQSEARCFPPFLAEFCHAVPVYFYYQFLLTIVYSIPDKIPTTLPFSHVNWCKTDVFTLNIMALMFSF